MKIIFLFLKKVLQHLYHFIQNKKFYFVISIFFIILFNHILLSDISQSILNLILNNEITKAEEECYNAIIVSDSPVLKEKINFLLGYIKYIKKDYEEAERRFANVRTIKEREKNFFLEQIKIIKNEKNRDTIQISPVNTYDFQKDLKIQNTSILVRVLLFEVSKNSTININTDNTMKIVYKTKEREKIVYSNNEKQNTIKIKDRLILFNDEECYYIEFEGINNSLIKINKKNYKGKIIIRREEKKYLIINEIDIEEYVKGVITQEIGMSWHSEVIKAQSIIARTYAYYYVQKAPDAIYHLKADYLSQVYGGVNSETEKTNKLVEETRGIIIVSNSKPIIAYYHSDSGGHTETSKNVWGITDNYTISKIDKYGVSSPVRYWKTRIKSDEIKEKLNNNGYNVNEIEKIIFKNRTASGRYKTIEIYYDGGKLELDSNKFRILMDSQSQIKSTLFIDIYKDGDYFCFEGRGFGHGVGLAQWSAKEMAESGKNYKEILEYFYKNIEFANL